jgi:hypothetical protein
VLGHVPHVVDDAVVGGKLIAELVSEEGGGRLETLGRLGLRRKGEQEQAKNEQAKAVGTRRSHVGGGSG